MAKADIHEETNSAAGPAVDGAQVNDAAAPRVSDGAASTETAPVQVVTLFGASSEPPATPSVASRFTRLGRKPILNPSADERPIPSVLAAQRRASGNTPANTAITTRMVSLDLDGRLRDSPVPHTAYLRFQVVEGRRQLANECRQQREALMVEKVAQEAEWMASGRERVAERLSRQKATRKLQDKLRRRRCEAGQALRTEHAKSRELLHTRQEELRREMRERVQEANARDARLDAAELAVDERERSDGLRQRIELERHAEEVRSRQRAVNKEIVGQIRARNRCPRERFPHPQHRPAYPCVTVSHSRNQLCSS